MFPSNSYYSALAGFVAGGATAAVTTPLDVVKTRIMLSSRSESQKSHKNISINSTLHSLWKEGGLKVLFSGVVPRTCWMSIGGAIFLGSYDLFKNVFIPSE